MSESPMVSFDAEPASASRATARQPPPLYSTRPGSAQSPMILRMAAPSFRGTPRRPRERVCVSVTQTVTKSNNGQRERTRTRERPPPLATPSDAVALPRYTALPPSPRNKRPRPTAVRASPPHGASPTQPQHEVDRALLLNVVVADRFRVVQLRAARREARVRGDEASAAGQARRKERVAGTRGQS